MENKSGNGSESPFGNGKGATASGPAGKPTDFVAKPTSNAGGGHDFVANPKGTPGSGGTPTDFAAQSCPAQPKGPNPDINPQSVPQGGTLPFKGAPKPLESGSKPFKV